MMISDSNHCLAVIGRLLKSARLITSLILRVHPRVVTKWT